MFRGQFVKSLSILVYSNSFSRFLHNRDVSSWVNERFQFGGAKNVTWQHPVELVDQKVEFLPIYVPL